jgi:hypothetical protein
MKLSTRRAPTAARLAALVAAGLALGATQQALAAGTASNTTVNNLATMSYSVGGVPQPNIGSSATGNTSGAGTATTFVVDRKINLTIQRQGASATSVTPGQSLAVSTFLLTNLGNDVQDFSIGGVNLATGTADPFGSPETDNFDASACTVRVDGNANGTYEPANDTATFIDELAGDGTRTVFVLCDIPATQVNGDFAVGAVTATALVGGNPGAQGAVITETAGANTAGVDTVFADGSGTESTDLARDGTYTDRNAFLVSSATLSISKSAQLICDPFNSTTNPKNIPGAIVRWTITITNAVGAGSPASLSQVTDALSANTTFDANLVTGAGGAAGCVSATGTPESVAGSGFKLDVTGDTRPGTYPKFFTTANDADGANHTAGTVSVNFATGMPVEAGYTAGELKPGESVVVYFNVTIN